MHEPPGALDLLKRTKQFALDSLEFYRRLPQTQEAKTAGLQFLRASSSVGANDRAAKRGRSRAEFAARLGVVVEEADESVYWLEYMQDGHICVRRCVTFGSETAVRDLHSGLRHRERPLSTFTSPLTSKP